MGCTALHDGDLFFFFLQIKLLASPTFSLVTTTYNDKEGIALLNEVIAAITAEMKKRKGNVIVKLAVCGATPCLHYGPALLCSALPCPLLPRP